MTMALSRLLSNGYATSTSITVIMLAMLVLQVQAATQDQEQAIIEMKMLKETGNVGEEVELIPVSGMQDAFKDQDDDVMMGQGVTPEIGTPDLRIDDGYGGGVGDGVDNGGGVGGVGNDGGGAGGNDDGYLRVEDYHNDNENDDGDDASLDEDGDSVMGQGVTVDITNVVAA